MGGDLGRAQAYRRFRLRVMLATAVLFFLGLLAAWLLRLGSSPWDTIKWAAISAPVVVAAAIMLLLPLGRTAQSLGEGAVLLRMRPVRVFWLLSAIVLPWIAGWLLADMAGRWFLVWRQQGDGGEVAELYLWSIRFAAGIGTYSLASAIGVILTLLFDSRLENDGGEPP